MRSARQAEEVLEGEPGDTGRLHQGQGGVVHRVAQIVLEQRTASGGHCEAVHLVLETRQGADGHAYYGDRDEDGGQHGDHLDKEKEEKYEKVQN